MISLQDKPDQKLICVDKNGKETGQIIDRRTAHSTPGVKHLAIQVLVFDGKGNIILHERPARKVGGSTMDAPTTHVLAGETPEMSAARCLLTEYGIKNADVTVLGGVAYDKDYGDGSCENEYLIAAFTVYSGPKITGSAEAPVVHYIRARDVAAELDADLPKYAVWLGLTAGIVKNDKAGAQLLA